VFAFSSLETILGFGAFGIVAARLRVKYAMVLSCRFLITT